MHARIRQYASPVPADELVQSGRAVLSKVALLPGFVSCFIVDLGEGRLACISIGEDPAALEAVDSLAASWLAEPGRVGEASSGSILFQRGL